MAQGGIFYSLPETNPNLQIDVARDFVPIGMIAEEPELLAVHPQLSVNSLTELIALARNRPGEINYGAGRGSLPHITGERFKQRASIELTFVPYSATAGAIHDSLSGMLPFVIESQAALSGAIEFGLIEGSCCRLRTARFRLSKFTHRSQKLLRNWATSSPPAGSP